MTPQVVVRGIAIPDSTRCVEYSDYVFGSADDGPGYTDGDFVGEVCYVDISVSQYVVGNGPKTVPVVVGWRFRVPTNVQGYGSTRYYNELVQPIEDVMGGFEFVMALARPLNMAWGEWDLAEVWDVQRRTDGTVVGQHELYSITGQLGNKAEYEYPLAELQRLIRDAHAKLSVEFGGKIGAETDSPQLVSDANRSFLLAQLRELGAYDVENVTPMPAPVVSLPLPPTGLFVTRWTNPDPEVDIAWTAPVSSTVTHYKIVRIDSLGNEKVIAEALPGEFTETTDRDLPVAGVEYTYTVIAVNDHGESAPSAGETVRNGPPNPPTDLYVSLQPGNEADLEWYAPASSHVTGYRVERRQGNGAWVTLQDDIPSEHLETTDFGLVSGQTYTYRVISLGEWADSTPSTPYILHVP